MQKVVFVVLATVLGIALLAFGSGDFPSGFGIVVAGDRPAYKPGEPIVLSLTVYNYTPHRMTFTFPDAQRFDFEVKNEEGKVVYRWSKGKSFAQMMGEKTLGPETREVTYRATLREELMAGNYVVTGSFLAEDKPMAGEIVITVAG